MVRCGVLRSPTLVSGQGRPLGRSSHLPLAERASKGRPEGTGVKNYNSESKGKNTQDGVAQTRLKGNKRVGERSQAGPRSGEDGEEKLDFRNLFYGAGSVTQW